MSLKLFLDAQHLSSHHTALEVKKKLDDIKDFNFKSERYQHIFRRLIPQKDSKNAKLISVTIFFILYLLFSIECFIY